MNTMTNFSLKQTVLMRVRAVHTLRTYFFPALCALLLLVLALAGLGREVWVAHVIANMPQPTHIAALLRFLAAAFLNTTYVVQVLSIVAVGMFIWFTERSVRTLTTFTRLAL
jgi:hypothetical protein